MFTCCKRKPEGHVCERLPVWDWLTCCLSNAALINSGFLEWCSVCGTGTAAETQIPPELSSLYRLAIYHTILWPHQPLCLSVPSPKSHGWIKKELILEVVLSFWGSSIHVLSRGFVSDTLVRSVIMWLMQPRADVTPLCCLRRTFWASESLRKDQWFMSTWPPSCFKPPMSKVIFSLN